MTPRRGLVWPLLLIVVGATLLAANYGLIAPISFFALASLWPLILIIVGIDIAIGRRWPLAALGADVLVIAAAIALVTVAPASSLGILPLQLGPSGAPGAATIDVPRADSKTLTLRLSAGAGRYELRGGAASLVHAESDHDDLLATSSLRPDGRLDVRVDQGPKGSGFRLGPSAASHVTMQVASDIPISLTVDAGAGEFTIDTSALKITDARISVGAASLHVVLPQPTGDVPFTISAGASSISIEIPAGVEARVTTSGGLTSTHIENPRMSGSETAGYALATNRVTVRISAGATSVVIR
ncbi:MAG: DUF5668 domain-containing protein [Chloroflexota bacterium]|nr:DUF5668 domain-containing protein [Chloroflexota bacterium]